MNHTTVVEPPDRAHGDHRGVPSPPGRPTGAQLPRHYVRRPWILGRLSSDAPLTLVTGPAGTGKTVAVAAWSSECDAAVAWVTVTSSTGFWTGVADALGVSPASLAGTVGPDPAPAGDLVVRLAGVLTAELDHDVVLVLDDYHAGEDAALAASMTLFLRQLPDRLRVVIVSRRLPSLPLDRMRVAGDLCEIDVEDLLFSAAEAHELVQLLVPGAEPAVVEAIVTAADGWAAALRLGAHGAGARRDPSAEHDVSRHLDGYVMREVLGDEPDDVRDALGDLAMVERFPLALATALTGRHDTADLLERAQARGLFVRRVGLRGEYELHTAVRRTLLRASEERDPARVRACHQRAAAWLEAHDETIPALEQWLLAGARRAALRVLADRHVQLYDAGQEDAVVAFLAQLTPATTAADVSSLVDLAWCELVVDPPAFREHVEFAAWWAEHAGPTDPVAARRLLSLQAIVSLSAGDWDAGERRARASLDGFTTWFDDPVVRTSWNDVARAIALSERWDDADDDVREITVRVSRDPGRTLALEATRALGAALAGRPADAVRVASGVRMSPELANLTMSSCELALAEVLARRELGDATDTQDRLEWLVRADAGPMVYVRAHAAAELTQLHLDHGALPEAAQAFAELERVVDQEMTGAGGSALLGRTGTVLALGHGDVDRARRWADMVDDPFWGPTSRARVEAATRRDSVAELLDLAVPRSPRHEVVLAMLRASTAVDRDTAARWTEAAVHVAREHSMLQTLVSQRQLDLVERIAWQLPDGWMDRLRRASAATRLDSAANASLVEPLTVRERDVLRFLPSRLTLKEIADELYVSVNTLKFHLKVIYRKLGVNSRSEAAEVARSWGRVDQR